MTLYRHYKNKKLYRTIGIGKLESEGEKGEDQVIYALSDSSECWIRPASEFHSSVELEDGSIVPRFEPID